MRIRRLIFSYNYAMWQTKDDVYIFQAKIPIFSILHTYYSDDAGLNLSYIRYAIPKKYIQERPL